MNLLHSTSDIKKLSEGIDLECKFAAGKNGKGELPKKTFWESYSAFANTNGGIILLGVEEEKNHSFNFRNPGLMRISVEQAINGYEHDCRNQKMHQMFHFLGLGERAGSGIPNIFKWWGDNHWLKPSIYEELEPYDYTVIELEMRDVPKDVPKDVLKERMDKIFEYIKNNNSITTDELAVLCKVSSKTIKRDISKLKETNRLKRVGGLKEGKWEVIN